ncbi:hypothetical protein J2X06_001265 [Lysobacter niastensis]|uniref:Uncharacterized protein n=1 Tax=Lysobacter niastensis TaxID=380629 RepID=A0ABU1W8Z8_9GAMM|nr:hypothetical protein [Lysobacter niastensis]MDR7134081.1 hypothetical protein [Lysobacter niastensis]
MRAYKAFDESGIEELGPVSKDQVPALIAAAEASLSGESFGVGLYRSKKDFMEVRPVGKSEYLIWSDRISDGVGVLGWLTRKQHIEKIVNGQAQAIEAALYYMDFSRDAFERKYS